MRPLILLQQMGRCKILKGQVQFDVPKQTTNVKDMHLPLKLKLALMSAYMALHYRDHMVFISLSCPCVHVYSCAETCVFLLHHNEDRVPQLPVVEDRLLSKFR